MRALHDSMSCLRMDVSTSASVGVMVMSLAALMAARKLIACILFSGINVTGNVITIKQCEKFFRCTCRGIYSLLAQATQDTCPVVVNSRCDPLEVGDAAVEDIAVDVITLIAVRARSVP